MHIDRNQNSISPSPSAGVPPRPRIFNYLDYRKYLGDLLAFKKNGKSSFSLAVFSRKAGLQSRNYLKRVIDGERNLSTENIPKFCIGFDLKRREALYFEALVNYNQCKDEVSRKHYFQMLCAAAEGENSSAVEIAKDQFEIFNHWYILPVRELLNLNDFQDNPQYIAKKLKGKISAKEAKHAMDVLTKNGLIKKDSNGRWIQSDPVIRYHQDVINLQVRHFHTQMLNRSREAIIEDEFSTWNVRALTLAIDRSVGPEIEQKINEFFAEINKRYSKTKPDCDAVIQMNIQYYELTENALLPKRQEEKGENK